MGTYDKKYPGRYYDKGAAVLNVLHPDFGATYDADGNITNFNAVLAAVQAVLNALESAGGKMVRVLVPGDREYIFSGAGATIAAPIVGLKLSVDGCYVESDGAVIRMTDWDQTDAASAGTDSTAQDCFKVFSFRDGVVGGGARGLRFVGESDGTVLDTGPRPRAVAIAVDGASEITVEDCRGELIVGNLVMARGGNAPAGVPSESRKVIIRASRAFSCAENGFNFLGGTFDCAITGCIGIGNLAAGFESGTREGLVCSNNLFRQNKNGISHVGNRGVFVGNILRANTVSGFNFQHQDSTFDGSHNTISGGIIAENGTAGILADASTSRNTVDGVRIFDNGTGGNGEGIKLAATCTRYTIRGCEIYDSGVGAQKYGIHVITGSEITIQGNVTHGHSTAGLLAESTTDGLRVMGNDFGDAATIAATTANRHVRNNRGYVTETSGTATIPSGSTSVVVAHGLSTGSATTLSNIVVTPTNNLGSAAKFWISNVTSTQFTINVNAAPGGSGATFVWSASAQ